MHRMTAPMSAMTLTMALAGLGCDTARKVPAEAPPTAPSAGETYIPAAPPGATGRGGSMDEFEQDELTRTLRALRSDPDPSSVAALLDLAAPDRSASARAAAADHLWMKVQTAGVGRFARPEDAGTKAAVQAAGPRVLALLDDPDEQVRLAAIQIVGVVPVDGARARLEALAADDASPAVKQRAAKSLEAIAAGPTTL